jgi:hypothetical protein
MRFSLLVIVTIITAAQEKKNMGFDAVLSAYEVG